MTILSSELFDDMTAFDKWWQLNCEPELSTYAMYVNTTGWMSQWHQERKMEVSWRYFGTKTFLDIFSKCCQVSQQIWFAIVDILVGVKYELKN